MNSIMKCSQNCDDTALINEIESTKPPFFHQVSSHNFFKCFCVETCTSKRRLDMRGSIVHQKIERLLEDVDIPALLLFLKRHQDVVHVNLSSNKISDNGFINLLDHMLVHKNVLELDVQNNDITQKGIEYMVKVGEGVEIESLNLMGNKFGDEGSKCLALFLLKNECIRRLNVAQVDQTASSLIYFIGVLSPEEEISNTTLKCLDISRPNPGCMYYFDSAHFSSVIGHMLKGNTSLAALHLQKYNFDCHDIENLVSNAKYNNTLQLLDLGCNNIGDHGVAHLASWLASRPALKVLILCRNIATDHGARELSFSLPFSKLLSLDISYNKITDDGMVDILNTLKKSPLLRQLKMFGNCLGHPTAKIVKRMLMSQVLNQENIDVRPYRVDHRWYIARYEGGHCRDKFYDVSYGLFTRLPSGPVKKTRSKKTYNKYTYLETSEVHVQHSTITIVSHAFHKDLRKDCKCCYCFKCNALQYDESCKDDEHLQDCNCCKCKGDESSDWSADKSVVDRVVPTRDPMNNIAYILKRVNSDTRQKIVRWININEDTLREDLKAIADRDKLEESSSCNCSWAQLSITSLQKRLENSDSNDILILPRSNSMLMKIARGGRTIS
ncbi:leucine-rich repeat-containing protein 34 [Hylaeus anthracinus]|uniref:leucine-rich repeat-containing protein 34 n=1 Tax=Hylaeus anthracinus TaxID=313031 RepID=UPI0023B8DBC2|nr:leucine-rich repeat-containing protein 34 [Hylaeus anthracinus]